MKKSKSTKSNDQNENRSQIFDQITKRRLWLFRFITIIVIPIVFVSLLELFLRLFNFGYPTTPLVETKINDTKYVHDNLTFAYRFFPKKLAREFTPFRFKAAKPNNVFRIFILGGSAAQGSPDPAFSFWRILEVMLQLRYPNTKFEVFPLAMPAINSHIVLEIARESIEYDPDLFVVYLGHNEVVGPYGPGTVLTPIVSNRSMVRLGIRLSAIKISQLLNLGLEKLNIQKSPYDMWQGMEMFLQNQVQRNDPRLKITYQNFNDNLEELNHLGHKNDIKIIYSTVVSNLKDCPPFNSVHRSDISIADQQKWDGFYSSGSTYEETGEYKAAITVYLEAAKIDSHYADLHYRLGRCYWFTGNFIEAGKRYKQAREYDCNRFRADNQINQIIRSVATAKPGTTFLADGLYEAEQKSPNRVPGNEFLLEHVHLNFKGNYLVARTILSQLQHIFSDVLRDEKIDETVQISESLCAAYLAYNNYEHYRIFKIVLDEFIKEPPFTNQLYHTETIKHLEDELDSLQHVIQAKGFNEVINSYEDAIRKRPSDWWLHFKYGDFLAADHVGRYQEAANQFHLVMKTIPHSPNAYVMRGLVLGKLGRLQESLNHNQMALRMNPTIAQAYFNSGLVYQKWKNWELAIENYQKTVYYQPTHSRAYNNMAAIFSQQGNTSKALAAIEQGLKATPNDLHLNYNKAMILYREGRKAEAIKYLQYVLSIAPNEVKVQETLSKWLREEKQDF